MKPTRKDIIIYSSALFLQTLAYFVYRTLFYTGNPFGVFIEPAILAGVLTFIVIVATESKLKFVYPFVVLALYVISVFVVFGTADGALGNMPIDAMSVAIGLAAGVFVKFLSKKLHKAK